MANHGSGRPGARRLPSQAWSRLKPSANDPLESVGLPSKGDTRLNDFKAQEGYYSKITERYMKFCADSGSTEELERQFASISLTSSDRAPRSSAVAATTSSSSTTTIAGSESRPSDADTRTSRTTTAAAISANAPSSNKPGLANAELSIILSAMRKLREAIVATSRTDTFAQQAYVFIIRAAILVKAMESYHPALLYLLGHIHPHSPLPPAELHEFVGYRILDAACRQQDFADAYSIRCQYNYLDRKVENVLQALVHDDWVMFWRARRAVDGHQRRLMEWPEAGLRLHALKCLGRSYFSAEKDYVERSANMKWPDLVQQCQLGWELDKETGKVTIRRPKAK